MKSKTSNEEGIVKDGKSIDNTNASVQNNENDHIIIEKTPIVEPPKPNEVMEVENVNFDPNSDHDELFLKHQIDIQEHEAYQLNQFMSQPHKDEVHNKLEELQYVCNLPDNDFEMDLSESIDNFGQDKQTPIEGFGAQGLNLNELHVDEPSFDHHSGFLADDYIGSPRYYD